MKHQRKKITNYFKERELKGNTQESAEITAYGQDNNHGTRIEKSMTYNNLKDKYKDVLLKRTNFDELAGLQVRNANQDKDKGASNKAIESILNRVAPQETTDIEANDVIIKVSKE